MSAPKETTDPDALAIAQLIREAREEGRREERERCARVLERIGRRDEAYTIRNPLE